MGAWTWREMQVRRRYDALEENGYLVSVWSVEVCVMES